MSPRVKVGEPTAFSKAVIDAVSHMIGMSGFPVRAIVKQAGFSTNYFYTRMRYEAPFNTNDVAAIASALNVEPKEIIELAVKTMQISHVHASAVTVRQHDYDVTASTTIVKTF